MMATRTSMQGGGKLLSRSPLILLSERRSAGACAARMTAARAGGWHAQKRAVSHLVGSRPALTATASLRTANMDRQMRTLFTQKQPRPVRTTLKWALLAFALTFGVAYHLDSRSAIHRWIAMPVLHTCTDPETAQKLAIKLLSLGIMPRDLGTDDEVLAAEIAGLSLKNPIGLAAGFDKQAEAVDGLLNLGFGIVEVGSITPEPQPGNDLPRYFRLSSDRAAINRFGFNSDGHEAVLHRLKERVQNWLLGSSTLAKSRIPLPDSESKSSELLERATIDKILELEQLPKSLRPGQLLAINLGKNKTSKPDSVDDYVAGVTKFGPYADLLVVNVSSPNTPGLRALQRKSILSDLMGQVVKARDQLPAQSNGKGKVPILVKIAPDLDRSELHAIADAALASGVEGLIVSNTTISRPSSLLAPPEVTGETGGLSGAPLKPLSLSALQTVRKRVGDRLTIIGCGGIFSGQDALDFAKAGADAVELYTSFGYEGVGHPRRVKDELTALLKAQGTTWKAAVGTGLDRDAQDVRVALPENEKQKSKVGGLQDRLGETVAGVKGELEELRQSLGMRSALISPQSKQWQPQQSSELPSSARGTAQQSLFRPDASDEKYSTLIGQIHSALGIDDSQDKAEPASSATKPDVSLTEAQRIRVAMALQDPSVAPSVALQGAGEQATVGAGGVPTFGRAAVKQPQKLTSLDARGSKASENAAAIYANEGRVGMGGKSDFNAADRKRVV